MKQKRLKLTTQQAFMHYAIVWFLLLIPGLIIFGYIKDYITNTHTGVRSPSDMIQTSIIFSLIAIVFYFIQRHKLKFSEYIIKHSEDDFEEALKWTVKELDWTIVTHQKKFIQAIHPFDWVVSGGELVTIINDGDSILINSICNPNNRPSVISFGWNKKNIGTFLENLKAVTNQVPEKNAEPEIPDNELTFKKILTRLIMYPFCIFLIIIGVGMLLKPINFKTPLAGIGVIVIASIYLYSDILIITKRKNINSKW